MALHNYTHLYMTSHFSEIMFSRTIPVPGGGGATRMARGGIRLVHGHTKSTLITYFSGMKIDPKYVFLHAFFFMSVMSFPKFVYMTLFSNFARFCTPKRCTRVQCLVLKNNPNYVNFWTSLIPSLTFEWAPGPCPHIKIC